MNLIFTFRLPVKEIINVPVNRTGIYKFYQYDEIIYIGKSKNCLRDRLMDHCYESDSNTALYEVIDASRSSLRELISEMAGTSPVVSFDYVELPLNQIDVLEEKLIRQHHPIFNTIFNDAKITALKQLINGY